MIEKIEFDNEIYNIIRRNIKKYRLQKNMTADELAEIVDVSHEFIRQIESEKVAYNCSVKTLYLISIALDVRIDKFFEESEDI